MQALRGHSEVAGGEPQDFSEAFRASPRSRQKSAANVVLKSVAGWGVASNLAIGEALYKETELRVPSWARDPQLGFLEQ